jgi:hypothetical protein
MEYLKMDKMQLLTSAKAVNKIPLSGRNIVFSYIKNH